MRVHQQISRTFRNLLIEKKRIYFLYEVTTVPHQVTSRTSVWSLMVGSLLSISVSRRNVVTTQARWNVVTDLINDYCYDYILTLVNVWSDLDTFIQQSLVSNTIRDIFWPALVVTVWLQSTGKSPTLCMLKLGSTLCKNS